MEQYWVMTRASPQADDLILFAHIVQAGSFTQAARATGLPKSTLSRRLSALENQLGERLLQRTTRRQILTEFGERMLTHAERLSAEADEAAALARDRQTSPQGTLRVALPPEYRELSLVQVINDYARRYPDVQLELDLSPRRVDLLAERFDLAVRAATQLPDDSTLVARRIVTLKRGLYASAEYLDRAGTPEQPEDLSRHSGLMLIAGNGNPQSWQLSNGHRQWQGMPAHTLAANSLGLQQSLAMQGLGITALSERFANDPATPGPSSLIRVLPEWHLPTENLWCITPGRRLLPQRTLAFIELLREMLQGEG